MIRKCSVFVCDHCGKVEEYGLDDDINTVKHWYNVEGGYHLCFTCWNEWKKVREEFFAFHKED